MVVPAHNERERLPACLASVAAAADQVAVPVTVVVVLDACTDRSEDAIARPVRALSVSGRNVGAARAAGFAAAAPRSDAQSITHQQQHVIESALPILTPNATHRSSRYTQPTRFRHAETALLNQRRPGWSTGSAAGPRRGCPTAARGAGR